MFIWSSIFGAHVVATIVACWIYDWKALTIGKILGVTTHPIAPP